MVTISSNVCTYTNGHTYLRILSSPLEYMYILTSTYQGRSAQWSKHETKQMKRHETKLTDSNGNCTVLRSPYSDPDYEPQDRKQMRSHVFSLIFKRAAALA